MEGKVVDVEVMDADEIKAILVRIFTKHNNPHFVDCKCRNDIDEHNIWKWFYEYFVFNAPIVTGSQGYVVGQWR